MNWEAAHVVVSGVVALVGVANYVMLLSIRLEISKLNGELKEWARETFVAKDPVAAIVRRT